MHLDSYRQSLAIAHLDNLAASTGVGVIISVCANCGILTGVKDGIGHHGISHGLCRECFSASVAEIRQPKKKED